MSGAPRTPYPPVVVFDLDGTLLRGTSVTLLLAEHVGGLEEIHRLERAFAAGEISNRAIADASAASYAGRTTRELGAVIEAGPWIAGLAEAIGALTAAGTQVVVGTITWRLAGELLCARHGFAATSGTELHVNEGIVRGTVSRYFDEHDKRRFVEAWCAKRGIALADIAAVGDSRSDLPLFGAAGRSVALNATPEARAAATCAIDADDLRAVLPLLATGSAG